MFVSQTQVDHFLDYINSPHVIQDLPLGQRSIKLPTNKVVTVPNVIHMMISESIVKQYLAYAEESNFDPLSTSYPCDPRPLASHCRTSTMSVQTEQKPLMTSVMLHSV